MPCASAGIIVPSCWSSALNNSSDKGTRFFAVSRGTRSPVFNPKLNPLEGRDHWPHAFSVAIAGGGLPGGRVIGSTDPSGAKQDPERPVKVADIHATVQNALGIDPEMEVMTPANRPIAFSEGAPIRELLG